MARAQYAIFPCKNWAVADCVVVEVRVVPNASVRLDTVRNAVHAFISSSYETLFLPSTLEGWQDVPLLHSTIHRIRACESPCPTSPLPITRAALQVHVYQPNEAESF